MSKKRGKAKQPAPAFMAQPYRELSPETLALRAERKRMAEESERRRTNPTPEEAEEDRLAAEEVMLLFAKTTVMH